MDYDDEETLLKDGYREFLWNDQEANELLEEIQITIKEVQESEFYQNMLQQLQNSPHFQNNIHRVLDGGKGYDHRIQMVIYGLGTIQFNYRSHYQLAMAISLSRDLIHWIKETIHTFDPQTTPIDAKVMKALGCEVEYVNENFRRRVEKRPTLFFMPYVAYLDLGNLLGVNWRPSDLNKMILFTNVYEPLENKDLYAKTIQNHTIKFDCHYNYEGPLTFKSEWPFYNMTCHFFNLLPETKLEMPRIRRHQEENEVLDEDKCLTNCFPSFSHSIVTTSPGSFEWYPQALEEDRGNWLSSMIECRLPTWPGRFSWCPPYSDWTKLNFSAVVATTNYNLQQGSIEGVIGYGGIFHNGKRECLLSYSGPPLDVLDKEDAFFGDAADLDFANAVALREGLRFFMDLPSNGRRLIIEGDSVSIVRWANRLVPPPKRLTEVFLEICSLLSRMQPVIFRIFKQANSMAIELARERATKLLSIELARKEDNTRKILPSQLS